MSTYFVHEANMERLEKKMATIQKKCAKSHCSFKYEIVGEDFRTTVDNDGKEYTAKYFQVEVEGTAQYESWRFVATLDHHKEGNVVRAFDTEIEIPEKYKTCGPTCEHCNKIRSRKDTYLIYNEEKNEFKQVGKSCLQEFTNGLSAEDVAFFVSVYDAMEAAGGYSGSSFTRYIEVEYILQYAFECYKHWGYQKSANSYADENGYLPTGYRSTKDRVVDYYYINRAMQAQRDALRKEMDEVGFNADSNYAKESAAKALQWIRNEDPDNEYLRNLKVICSDQYTDYRSLGILVSLTTAYERHLGKLAAYEKKQKAQAEEKKASEYVGEVGQRLTVNCKTFTCVSSWGNLYGMTFLYKFTDENDNVYIWYASKCIDDDDTQVVTSITGTVKDHSEYNGLKQTVLTRCKAAYAKVEKEQEEPAPGSNDVQKALDEFFEFVEA